MIRVWRPAEPEDESPAPLRGLVEHVRLGRQHSFDGGVELLAFLEDAVLEPSRERKPDA